MFSFIEFLGFGQVELRLPAIEATPEPHKAPIGWSVWQESPDVISGNGAWPGGGYTIEDVDGKNVAGFSMGLFLANEGGIQEGWTTTFNNLTIGEKYSVTLKWQQATLTNHSSITYSGGNLYMAVDDKEKIFTSVSGIEDEWQTATFVFTAKAESVVLKIKVSEPKNGPIGDYGSAIVVDNSGYQLAAPLVR